MAVPTIPPIFYQVAFNADPNQTTIPPYWTDQSWRTQYPWSSERGRQYEQDANETGQWRPTLANPDGALDPSNTASPYAPNVVPYRQARIRCTPGPNWLTPDQSTAGEGTGYPAGIAPPASMNVSCGAGYPLTLAASGSAYQGAQVYQVSVPNGAAAPQNLLAVAVVDAQPGAAYAAQTQARVLATVQNLTLSVAIDWYSATGTLISTTSGAGVAITGGSTSWVTLSASGTAPPGTQYCAIRAVLGTTTTATASAQFDGLQFENSYFPTPFQVPFAVPPNLFPGNIASGGYDAQSATGWLYPTAGSVAYATALLAAPTGHTNALAWTTPAATTSASPLLFGAASSGPVGDNVQVVAATQYTASVYSLRAASADATLAITPTITWYGATAVSLGTSAGSPLTLATGAWGRASVTGTAPAGALWGRLSLAITTPASTTATNVAYLTGCQFEAAATASAWRDTGAVFSVITPFVERWPQSWSEQDATYGQCDVVGVDAFAALSQVTLRDPYVNEVLALGPNFYYPLSDPAGVSSVADLAGKRGAAPIENSPYGVGSLTLGTSITAALSPSGLFTGAAGPVATVNNVLSGSNVQLAETYVALHKTTATPGPPVSGGWSRILAFRTSTVPGGSNVMSLWTAYPTTWSTGNLSSFWMQISPAGVISLNCVNSSNFGLFYNGASSICDGNWHQVIMTVDPAGTGGTFMRYYVDGVQVATNSVARYPTGITADTLGAAILYGGEWFQQGYEGDIAHAIELPTALTTAQAANLYASWRSASSGESTGARVQRVLNWIPWTGPTAIDAGVTASMGPASDLTGATALDAINNITLTENGDFFVSSGGALTFQARNARYNKTVPVFTFGEHTATGEWPFEVVEFDDDPSHIANNVQVTQYQGSTFTAIDTASALRNWPRVYQRTVNTTSPAEAADAAAYLLSQYRTAQMRVSTLRLHPSAVPGLFLVCLQLELGMRIQVNRRPNGAPQISFNGFVEKIEWEWDPEGPEVFVTLQCSPANLASYWVLGAMHTSLHAQATAGASSISINALLDSAVNPLAASMPQNQQLTLEPGTVRAETVTVVPPLPATNPGYNSATLNVTPNLAFTHAIGTVACEPLPPGITDPTTYDSQSVLGALSTSFAAAASSGTNAITVNAPADGKTNALGSDLSTGDLLWLSPGTPQFEGYNLLHPNIATAGEGALPLAAGTSGAAWGLSSDVGTPTVTASGSAQQGANVWAVSVAGGVVPTKGLMYVLKVPVTAGLVYTASEYVRSATTGANPTVQIYLKFSDATGTSLAQANSGTTVLTGAPSAAWTRMTVTATAPANTVWAQIGLLLTATAPAGAWTWQADALQLEQAASASAFQVCPQVLSVATSYPGYTTCVITLYQNLTQNHAAGDGVCDPLPPGDTAPSQIAATSRVAY